MCGLKIISVKLNKVWQCGVPFCAKTHRIDSVQEKIWECMVGPSSVRKKTDYRLYSMDFYLCQTCLRNLSNLISSHQNGLFPRTTLGAAAIPSKHLRNSSLPRAGSIKSHIGSCACSGCTVDWNFPCHIAQVCKGLLFAALKVVVRTQILWTRLLGQSCTIRHADNEKIVEWTNAAQQHPASNPIVILGYAAMLGGR